MTAVLDHPATLVEALPRIRAVLAELARGVGERDLSFEHPDALVQGLADAGFGRLRVPEELGGLGGDLSTLLELLAEAGEADSNLPQIWRGHFTTIEILRREPDRAARERWLRAIGDGQVFGNAQSEPSAVVADAVARGAEQVGHGTMTTTTIRHDVDGTERVSGTKFYSTGARYADWIRVAVLDEDGGRGFAVVPARHEGVTHVDDWDGVGQRQTGSGTTLLRDVPIEPDGDIGRYRESLRGLDSFVQAVHLANLVGIARSIVAETVEAVRSRTRTSLHALTGDAAQDPEVLGVVGRLEVRRHTAEALLLQVARTLDAAQAHDSDQAHQAAYRATSAAQVGVIEAVLDAATSAFDALGSSAVRNGVHLDRHWRNARTLASHNPVVYKSRVLGDFLVNGAVPTPGYYVGRPSLADEEARA